jgi:Flp pilus assembly protein TadD
VLDPESPEAWYSKGITLECLDEDAHAEAAYEKAEELGLNSK